jgi:thioredoxin 1
MSVALPGIRAAATGGHHEFDLDRAARAPTLGSMTQIPTVTDDAFSAEVLESERPVLVDFTAAWCPPCRVMKPVLAELAAERDDLRVVQLDVDADQRTAAEYGVLSMPTFILFRDGREVKRLVGARPRRRLEAELAEAL